ncbi:MAG: hypothetical protein DSZ27_08420 [Thiomicrospira sp.]|nr:MAG: hypothetical protein DSZ27_08420 [Thiomicrospira sp.]
MDEEYIKQQKAQDDERRHQLEDIQFILASEQGRRFMSRLIHDVCGIHRSTFTGNSQGYFLEGQRNVGLTFFGDIVEANPEAYTKILMENKQ